MTVSTLCLGDNLAYSANVFGRVKAGLSEAFPPRLRRGIHYAFNGPVRKAIDLHGELTWLDYATLRICSFLWLPNDRLEKKFKAIGYAFLREARMLETSAQSS